MKPQDRTPHHVHKMTAPPSGNVDWRNEGCVNPIQNQGHCGSCWAFSSAGSMESSSCVASGTEKELLKLSEQQFVDCSKSYGNMGCNGGQYYYAWTYAQTHGIELESAYPYTEHDGECQYDGSLGKVSTDLAAAYTVVDTNGDLRADNIMSALDIKPVSISVRASSLVFQTYEGGVLTSALCGWSINHAIMAVGYDADAEEPYYTVRNSWGDAWGLQGYI